MQLLHIAVEAIALCGSRVRPIKEVGTGLVRGSGALEGKLVSAVARKNDVIDGTKDG